MTTKGSKNKKKSEYYPPDQIGQEYILSLIQAFKQQKKLTVEEVHVILHRSRSQLEKLPNLIEIHLAPEKEMTVVGDTHGQFFDLLQIFEKNRLPSDENPYLFNGDFIDRGSFGCEIFLTLACIKLGFPNSVHMLRGNHESKQCTCEYGFKNECEDKYDTVVYSHFLHVFNALPLCALINRKIFVVHGGIPSSGNISLEELQHLTRFVEPGEEAEEAYSDDYKDEYVRCGGGTKVWNSSSGVFIPKRRGKITYSEGYTSFLSGAEQYDTIMEMLWADPCEDNGLFPSMRMLGYKFGPNITKQFLEYNGLSKVIRSHEMRPRGYLVEHDGRLVTLFSCPNYCENSNLGAYIKIKSGKVKQKAAPANPSTLRSAVEVSGGGGGRGGVEGKKKKKDGGDGKKEEEDDDGDDDSDSEDLPSQAARPRILTISRTMSAPNLQSLASPSSSLSSSSSCTSLPGSAGSVFGCGSGSGSDADVVVPSLLCAATASASTTSPSSSSVATSSASASFSSCPSSPSSSSSSSFSSAFVSCSSPPPLLPPAVFASVSAASSTSASSSSASSSASASASASSSSSAAMNVLAKHHQKHLSSPPANVSNLAESVAPTPSITLVFHTYTGAAAPAAKQYYAMPMMDRSPCSLM